MADRAEVTLGLNTEPLKKAIGKAQESFSKFGSSVRDKMSSVGSGMRAAFSKAGSVIRGVFSKIASFVTDTFKSVFGFLREQIPLFAIGIGAGLAVGIKNLNEYEESLSRIKAQLRATQGLSGQTVESLTGMADEMMRFTTVSDQAVMNAQTVLLQMINVRGEVFDEATKLSADLAAVTGSDMASAADRIGRALQDPIQGLKMLRAEGVIYTQQEQLMIETMIRSGDIIGAQEHILKRLSNLYGGAAAEQANTFTGKVRQLNNILGAAWRSMAESLTPALEKMLPWVRKSAEFVEKAADVFGDWVVAIVEWAEQSGDVIESWAEKAKAAFMTLSQAIVSGLTFAFTYVQTAFEDFPAFVKKAQADVLVIWEQLSQTMQVAWEHVTVFLQNVFLDTIDIIKEQLPGFGKNFGETMNWMTEFVHVFELAWRSLQIAATTVVTGIVGLLEKLGKGIESVINLMPGMQVKFTDTLTEMRKGLGQLLEEQVEGLKKKFVEGPELDKMDELIRKAKSGERATVSGVSEADKRRLEELKEKAREAGQEFGSSFDQNFAKNREAVDGLMERMKNAFGFGEDARVGKDKGKKGRGGSSPFILENQQSGGGGAFEDLLSLQKRIQSAAFKSPEVIAIQQQQQQSQQQHREQMQVQREQAEAVNEQVEETEGLRNDMRNFFNVNLE